MGQPPQRATAQCHLIIHVSPLPEPEHSPSMIRGRLIAIESPPMDMLATMVHTIVLLDPREAIYLSRFDSEMENKTNATNGAEKSVQRASVVRRTESSPQATKLMMRLIKDGKLPQSDDIRLLKSAPATSRRRLQRIRLFWRSVVFIADVPSRSHN